VEIYGKWSDSKVIVAQPSLVLEQKSSKSIKLSWKKISGATSYTVYRSTSSYTGFKKIKTTKSTKLTNSGLKSNTYYYYYVVANGVKVKGKNLKSTKATYREIVYMSTDGGQMYYTYEKVN
jgi:fibronectin type 3 domain-containing protein